MYGALSTALLVTLFALVALRPPMPRHSSPFNLQFGVSWIINEQPILGFWWLLSGTLATLTRPQVASPLWWAIMAITLAGTLVLVVLGVRTRSARPALAAAFHETFGKDATPRWTRPPWWRILLVPIIAWRPHVRRIRNRRYGPAFRGNLLDVYVARRQQRSNAPVLVYLSPNALVVGSKMLGARPLLYRMAAEGWVCISANHRLFRSSYADKLADVRAVVTWIRANAPAYGGDPHTIVLSGGSSGAHLAATAALTGTEVSGVIGFYGFYGSIGGPQPNSPMDCVNADAPPFLIVHGTLDTLVLSRDARAFADRLRAASGQPVAYAELPGTQHNFDFFHSLRYHPVTDAVVRFAELTGIADRLSHPPHPTRSTSNWFGSLARWE